MPNPYFQFKQFTIYQDRCAMKVGTDGVLLGAWVEVEQATTILDIGTGTGLIALMLAQRSKAKIDAIETEAEAKGQAQENVQRSLWKNRIQVFHSSLQKYQADSSAQYDLLVSNPPFFANSLKAAHDARSMARHNDSLNQQNLLQASLTLLAPRGRLAVIYPVEAAQILLSQAADFGLSCQRKLWVKPKPNLPPKRLLLELIRSPKAVKSTEQTIVLEKETRHHYTPEFISLIKDFYLKY